MISADCLIDDADLVATCAGPAPRRGSRSARSRRSRARRWPASTAASSSSVPRTSAGAPSRWPDAQVLDARGRTVVPGFVDPHTHLVYAGDRRDELRRRLAGATYTDIAAAAAASSRPCRRDAEATRGRAGRRSPAAARRDAGARHDDRGGQKRIRAGARVRAEDAARDSATGGRRSRSSSRRRSWARTNTRWSIRERRASTSTWSST